MVTYHQDVAPILAANCVGCHREGGAAPFPLETYEQAKAYASLIRQVTEERRMPPVNMDASGACQPFADTPYLSEAQLKAIRDWAQSGAEPGDPRDHSALIPRQATLDNPTTTVTVGGYTPDDSTADDYRCFVVNPDLTRQAYLTAFEVRPGSAAQDHHMILYLPTDDDAEQAALESDAAEPGTGYTCYGGPGVSASAVAGWAPGTGATAYPEGTGVRIPAGRQMIIQMHFNTVNGVEPDTTEIALQLAQTVRKQGYLAPIADGRMVLPAGEERAQWTFDWPLSQGPQFPGLIHAAFPHMHKRGVSMRVDIVDGDEETCLSDVPRWDFNWQRFFFYEEPVPYYPTSTGAIRTACVFDTSGDTVPVTWGEGTDDEMCLTYFYVTF